MLLLNKINDSDFRMAHNYGISEAAFLSVTNQVIKQIFYKINHFIKWPKREKYQEIAQAFCDATGYFFPGIIGVIYQSISFPIPQNEPP